MDFGDDEKDFVPSSSSGEYFTDSDRGKKRQVERKKLKAKVDLSKLKDEVVVEPKSAPKTKSAKEQEEDDVQTAQDNPDEDTLMQREEKQPEIADEETATEEN